MKLNSFKKQVAKVQLETALVELMDKVEEKDLNTVVALLNRLNRCLSDASTQGVIAWKERYDHETNLVVSALNLIDSVA